MSNEIKEFKGDYFFLSNFYPCQVGEFPSSENAYQYLKVLNQKEKFLKCSASESKRLGRQLKMRENWDDIRLEVMYRVVRQKFEQNLDLLEKLLETENKILIESNSWGDSFWGYDLRKKKGENHLGKILMRIREEMKNSL